jgi:hypothetical protein
MAADVAFGSSIVEPLSESIEEALTESLDAQPSPAPFKSLIDEKLLIECLEAGCPWPAELDEVWNKAEPYQVSQTLRHLRVRERLYSGIPDEWRNVNGEVPLLSDVVYRRNLISIPKAAELVEALQKQFAIAISAFQPRTQRLLLHAYEVVIQPFSIGENTMSLWGLTFIHRTEPHFSSKFVPMKDVLAVSLTYRVTREYTNKTSPAWDIKLHEFTVDPATGCVYCGGFYGKRTNQPPKGPVAQFSRCALGKYWMLTPKPGNTRRHLDESYTNVFDAGLSLSRMIERAACHKARVKAAPDFPAVYIAFASAEDAIPEMNEDRSTGWEWSEELKEATLQRVRAWCYAGKEKPIIAGKEKSEKLEAVCAQIKADLMEVPRSWDDLERQLLRRSDTGEVNVKFLLGEAWIAAEEQVDGLVLVPWAFICPEALPSVFSKSKGVYLRMDDSLMGRETWHTNAMYVDGRITDDLGNTIDKSYYDYSAELRVDHQHAAPQPHRQFRANEWNVENESQGIIYNFDDAPAGQEKHFQRPGY